MRGIKLLVSTVIAVCALGAFGVASASALPLFVSKSGKYPIHVRFHSGLALFFVPPHGPFIHCKLDLGLALLGLRLWTIIRLYHKCVTVILFSQAECNSPGEPKGLLLWLQHLWWGYLTNATGEKMVGALAQPESGNVDAEFECEANALEKIHVTMLGEAVGSIAAAEVNKSQSTFNVKFEQSSSKQTPQTFLLPSPLSLMTGVHMTADITGSVSETVEAAEEGAEELTLEPAGETGEIQG